MPTPAPSTSPDPTIHVLMSSDNGFARPLMVSLYSLVQHFKGNRPLVIHLLDFGITDENLAKIREIVRHPQITLDWRKQTDIAWMPKAAIDAGTTPAQCARMLAASIFPDTDKILFLDADIVVQADVGELWDIPLTAPIGAIRDQFFPFVGLCTWLDFKEMGLTATDPHFNGGIFIADLNKWRQHDFEAQLMTFYCRYHSRLKTHDQDALNAIFKQNWQEFTLGWNRGPWLDNAFHAEDLGVSKADFIQAKTTPKIIHYPTPDKPWNTGILSFINKPFFDCVAQLDLGDWGKPRRDPTLQERAWGLMMGLTHRIHLLRLGILSPWRFAIGTISGLVRRPHLALLAAVLFIARKTNHS